MEEWTLNWLTEEIMNKYSVNFSNLLKFLNYFQKQRHYKVSTVTLDIQVKWVLIKLTLKKMEILLQRGTLVVRFVKEVFITMKAYGTGHTS